VKRKNPWRTFVLVLASAGLFVACSNDPVMDENALSAQARIRSIDGFMPDGVRRAYQRSCASCHGLDGRGITGVAPNLKRAAYRSPEGWERYLRQSRAIHPVSQPQPLWLDADEIKDVAQYLSTVSRRP
jgi:mono/diheme cytochrome c family protein